MRRVFASSAAFGESTDLMTVADIHGANSARPMVRSNSLGGIF
jgi:hypothetical protein